MNVRATRFLAGRWPAAVAAVLGLFALAAPAAQAVPVEVDLSWLAAAQMYHDKGQGDDPVYLLVTGSAGGKALDAAKLPKDKPWEVNRQKPAADPKKPLTLWTGDLADGQFAALTFTVYAGAGADEAAVKAYAGKLAEAAKKVPAAAAPKLASVEDAAKLATDLLAAQRPVVTAAVKPGFDKDRKADQYVGQFTVLAWNNAGTVWTRVDPVGLTFGEHYGTNEKIYTKIKRTRQNVLVADDTGDFSEQAQEPINDDETGVRVKMLQTEKMGDDRKTVDYLAEVQVKAAGKPTKWTVAGEVLGKSDIHVYWDHAETKKPKAAAPK